MTWNYITLAQQTLAGITFWILHTSLVYMISENENFIQLISDVLMWMAGE